MKNIFFFLVYFLFAQVSAYGLELQNGDVLLMSFNCYECRIIESETNSPFSHSGVVIKDEFHQIRIGQSLGQVALYSLDQFLKNKTPNTFISVYRSREFINLKNDERTFLEDKMLSTFNAIFKGAPFDTAYRWNNYDEQGRELLYCSEFIAKFLDHFLSTATIPYPLTYKKNEDFWLKYFGGVIPEGELGNSPASFSHDDRFIFIGTI